MPTVELLLADSVDECRIAWENGEAVMLEADEGFLIVSVRKNRKQESELFVWALAGKGGRCIRTHQTDLAGAALHMGCKRIVGRVQSDRVAKLLERCGWKRTHVEYALEV